MTNLFGCELEVYDLRRGWVLLFLFKEGKAFIFCLRQGFKDKLKHLVDEG